MLYRNIFTHINENSLDGFYHLSTKKGSLSSSRKYCNALDNSLLPVVKSKGQTTALADFVKSKSTIQLYTYIGLTATGKYKGTIILKACFTGKMALKTSISKMIATML